MESSTYGSGKTKQCKQCGEPRHRQAKTGLCLSCYHKPVRTCTKCGTQVVGTSKGFCGTLGICKPCYQRQWRSDHPEKPKEYSRHHHILHSYGLTNEEYTAFVTNPCEICGTDLRPRQVDHDHATGELRAALCQPCNVRLGFYETLTEEWREAADAYLAAFAKD